MRCRFARNLYENTEDGLLSWWHVHAREYAHEAEQNPETKITTIWDEIPERGSRIAIGGWRSYHSLTDLLADPDIDAIIVTTPTSLHLEVITAAVRAGKHIFVEKVLAPMVSEAIAILDAARESNVCLFVALNRLPHGCITRIKEIIDSGQIGAPTFARIPLAHDGALPNEQNSNGWLPESFFHETEACGGALIDLGAHPLYLLRYFLGLPKAVTASLSSVTTRPVEDNAVVTF